MAKGITYSCANIWRSVARAGGWWSAQRLAREWNGIFDLDEVLEHLVTLKRAGFLEARETRREGTEIAYTTKCKPLPGETLVPVTPSADEPVAITTVAVERYQAERMRSVYVPSQATYRPGAFDHVNCPSLQLGKRRAYHGRSA